MALSLGATLTEATGLAAAKSQQVRHPGRYLFASALAGAYVGVAVVLLIAVSAPFAAAGSPATKLVQGAVFGIALTLVVFAGAELFTGNAMYLLQGFYARTVRWPAVALVWVGSLVGNLVGSMAFAALVHGGGTLGTGDGSSSTETLIASMTAGKAAASGPQLLWRAVLCNMLVCLALWMGNRATNDMAKLGVMWWALLAFIASGFEHSVANMTIFSLGVFQGSTTWVELGRNLLWTVPGNVIGGGLLVGLGYAWLAGPRQPVTGDAAIATEPTPRERVGEVVADAA
ncbi:MAG: formate/nitrite transporter family protein [Actinobacteria bacterium]|nr:formate/nitrite transporter family protein [Actinomycetota bacterium]